MAVDTKILREIVASANIATPHEAIAAVLHAVLFKNGYQLVAEESSSSPSPKLPQGWNSSKEEYNFIYSIPGSSSSSERLSVKLLPIENEILAHFWIEGDEASNSALEINVAEYIISVGGPFDNADKIFNLDLPNLGEKIRSNVVEKYKPKKKSSLLEERSRPLRHDPLIDDDPYFHQPRFGPGGISGGYGGLDPGRNPYLIGDGDLNPNFGGRVGGDGMYVGPGHPMFQQPRGGPPMHPSGGFYPPRSSIPPGARYDPMGPSPFDPRSGFGGQGPLGPGGDPDNDHLPPPGYRDMFM